MTNQALFLLAGILLAGQATSKTWAAPPDSCTKCHASHTSLLQSHLKTAIACTVCHSGDASALEKDSAHKTMRHLKSLSGRDLALTVCGPCHAVDKYELNLTPEKDLDPRCTACHRPARRAETPTCIQCHFGSGERHRAVAGVEEGVCTGCHLSEPLPVFLLPEGVHKRSGMACVDCHAPRFGDNFHSLHSSSGKTALRCELCHGNPYQSGDSDQPKPAPRAAAAIEPIEGFSDGALHLAPLASSLSHPLSIHGKRLSCRSCHLSSFGRGRSYRKSLVYYQKNSVLEPFINSLEPPGAGPINLASGFGHNVERKATVCQDCHQTSTLHLPGKTKGTHGALLPLEGKQRAAIDAVGLCLSCHRNRLSIFERYERFRSIDQVEQHLRNITEEGP